MKFRRSLTDAEEGSEINMSPLIDMVFILLIFFIVTTTFVEESGVEVDKPSAASASRLDKNSIILAITAQGQVVYGGKEIGIGGVRPLVTRLCDRDPLPVIVQTDKATPSGVLVRVIDEAKLGKAKNVSIATEQGG
ncbi:MAG: biopolymer transporter ExbD [Verrucomicrobiae bacterium]|nr:biopolymer transporter ExbD [Verrucomicrobiae bacterium]